MPLVMKGLYSLSCSLIYVIDMHINDIPETIWEFLVRCWPVKVYSQNKEKCGTIYCAKYLKSHLTSVCHALIVFGKYLLVAWSLMHMRPPATS